MTTYEMTRCKKCSWLIEDENGNLICSDFEREIHDVPDDDCALFEEEWIITFN